MIPMPPRIERRPRDKRGYPIPWNTLTSDENGEVFFTVNDDRKARRALREGLCPLCGEHLGKWKWFVGGPRSAFDPHGWYLDLPGHHECIQYAIAACPYLAAPRYLGRIDVPNPEKLPPEAQVVLDETMIPERPEVFVAVAGSEIETQGRGLLQPYIRPARPALAYEFWRHGLQISQEMVMPYLRAVLGAEFKIPEVR